MADKLSKKPINYRFSHIFLLEMADILSNDALGNPEMICPRHGFVPIAGLVCGYIIYSLSVRYLYASGCGDCTSFRTPEYETSYAAGIVDSTLEMFAQQDSDDYGTSWNNDEIQEYTGMYGTNTCWWKGSTVPSNPGVSGGNWTFNGNSWGYDNVGANGSYLGDLITTGASDGVKFPCTITVYQGLEMEIPNTTIWCPYFLEGANYNVLTTTVYNNPRQEVICRNPGGDAAVGACATVPF